MKEKLQDGLYRVRKVITNVSQIKGQKAVKTVLMDAVVYARVENGNTLHDENGDHLVNDNHRKFGWTSKPWFTTKAVEPNTEAPSYAYNEVKYAFLEKVEA